MKYKWKQKPYRHQVEAILKLLENGFGGALLMEPRTGKTKVAIDYACILHLAGKVSRVVILCPVSVMGVWEEQFAQNAPVKYRVTIWDRKGRKVEGNGLPQLPKYGKGILDIVIMNYDAFSTPGRVRGRDEEGNILRSKSRGGRYDVKKALQLWQPDLMILDESHRIKSPSAKKSTALHSFHDTVPFRVIMTGTVVTKKKRVFDIYSQWKFLNRARFARMTLADFKEKFGVWTKRNGYPQFLRNKNERVLRRLIHADAYSITRAECYDLPARLPPEIIRVELEESAGVYDQMAADMVARIHTGEITEASIVLVQSLRLAQITSGLARTEPDANGKYPEGRLVRIGHEKLRILEDRLLDFAEADEKVVIAARFVADLEAIVALCNKLGFKTWLLRGGMKREDRDRARRDFQAFEDGPAAFVMQPQAGSLGIDLSTAGTFIWYSLTQSYVDFTQAEDRIALNARGTRYIYLLARGTYDEIMYQSLMEDHDVATTIMKRPEVLLREE